MSTSRKQEEKHNSFILKGIDDEISEIGWKEGTLVVLWPKGYYYRYENVSLTTSLELASADSPSDYFDRNMRGKYEYSIISMSG